MKLFCQVSMLLAALLTGVCQAQETSVCKSGCGMEKKQCRAKAESATDYDTAPLIQKDPEPSERFSADSSRLGAGSATRTLNRKESDKRRMERLNACDNQYMICARKCSVPPPPADK